MYKNKTAIVGIGQTKFSKKLEPSEFELAGEAVLSALGEAGIHPSEVDALGSYTMEDTTEAELAQTLGFGDLNFFGQVNYGGGAAPGVVGQVALAVASGVAKVGVVWRARKRSDPGSRVWSQVNARSDDHWKWSRPSGLLRPVDEVAMLMQRYMHEYNISREQLAPVAISQRRFAHQNPRAQMAGREMTLDDYMAARMISDPLCLFDNCLETDGAIAVVIVSAERAGDLPQTPVYIHAYTQGMSQQHQVMSDFHRDKPVKPNSLATARNLWRQSDYGPEDIQAAQIYDAFSPAILFSLEAYGFCKVGEAADYFTENCLTESGGTEGLKLAINTSGGGLSEAYIHGMNIVLEGVRQVRGDSTAQVAGLENCLITGCDPTPNAAMILTRCR